MVTLKKKPTVTYDLAAGKTSKTTFYNDQPRKNLKKPLFPKISKILKNNKKTKLVIGH